MSPQEAIAHYRIVSKLGEGGMGVVYRATDTKLNRDVAIKMLPAALAADAQYMARFEREAQTLAALNHPNIATVYGVEQGALVMELVDGPTLADRIGEGAVPLEEALPIARQMVDGLEAAHERGIIHRDLKPANIKLTAEGKVKLLDFGLAKSAGDFAAAASRLAPGASPTMSPTLSLAMTQAGMILGTAAYMSPEQARGKPVDKRADIWAFGVVLFEMLTGRQLFGGGETVTDTLASVVKDAPNLNALPADTPAHVRRLLDRCLRKDVKTRLRDIGEARVMLDEPPAPEATMMPAAVVAAATARRTWLPWTMTAALATMVAGLGWYATRPAPLAPLLRLKADLGKDAPMDFAGGSTVFAISPDGLRLAAVVDQAGKAMLATRLLNQESLTMLSGTEGAQSPFFSPDGEWIGFWADSKLKKVAVTGGAPLTLCSLGSLRGASWFDDTIVVGNGTAASGLVWVPAAGGEPLEITKLGKGERTHRQPQVLAEYGLVLYAAAGDSRNYDAAEIVAQSLKTGARSTLVRGGHSPQYLSSGHLLYQHEGTLYAARFDPRRMALTGLPAPVLEGVGDTIGGGTLANMSRNGTLVYLPGASGRSRRSGTIVWLDAADKQRELHAVAGSYTQLRLSPDNRRLAFIVMTDKGNDVWVKDLERGATSRLSFTPGSNYDPIWTPDGKAIVYRGPAGMYWIPSDGSGQAQLLAETTGTATSFSPDGKYLAFLQRTSFSLDIFTAPLEGKPGHPRLGKPTPFVATPALEVELRFSPDGRWIAYTSQESGKYEIYVRPFPGPGGRWQISTGGGDYSMWSPKTQELFYESLQQGIMVVPYTVSGDAFVAGKPRLWTPMHPSGPSGSYAWDVAADGKRLVIFKPESETGKQEAQTELTVLVNFGDELKRKVK